MKLADLGITKTQSSRWQKQAVPEPEFENRVAAAKRKAARGAARQRQVGLTVDAPAPRLPSAVRPPTSG